MLKIVIADDHRLVRESLVKLLQLQEDLEVVGQAADGLEALDVTRRLAPDLLLLDITMPEMDGLAVLAELDGGTETQVIVVSMHLDRDTIERALALGAAGYVSKRTAATALVEAARVVGAGGHYLCERSRDTLAKSAYRRVARDGATQAGT